MLGCFWHLLAGHVVLPGILNYVTPKAVSFRGQVPLRSTNFPEGLPKLSHTNRIRVSKANKLYEFVGTILRFAHSRNLIVVVQNPRSSLFWMTRWWRFIGGIPTFYLAHQACAYGSQRPKWTVLASNCDMIFSEKFAKPALVNLRRISIVRGGSLEINRVQDLQLQRKQPTRFL